MTCKTSMPSGRLAKRGAAPSRAAKRGAAMMLVMVLLMLLVAMAVPFLFTMAQQEGTAAGSMAGEDARIAARTGADHAFARLHRTNGLVEFDRWYAKRPQDVRDDYHNNDLYMASNPNWDNPYFDSNLESLVDVVNDINPQTYPRLMDQNNKTRINFENFRDIVVGVNVEDESGKVDFNTAPPLLIGSLLGAGTVVAAELPAGLTFPTITLDQADFLGDRETFEKPGTPEGPGLVVIGDILFSYEKRRGNVLYEATANAPYPGDTAIFGVMWEKLEPKAKKAMVLRERAVSPLAYKIAYMRTFKSPDGRTPYNFNNLQEIRDIAKETWFPGWITMNNTRGFWEGLDPITYQELPQIATVIAPSKRFDGRFLYPHLLAWQTFTGGVNGNVAYIDGAMHFEQMESGKQVQCMWLDTRYPLPPELYHPLDARKRAPSFGRGSMIRISQQGGESRLMTSFINGMPRYNSPPWSSPSHCVAVRQTFEMLQREPVVVEVAERAAININTAPFAVLKAAVLGQGGTLKFTSGDVIIEEPQIEDEPAATFADRVLSRTRFDAENVQNYNPFDDLQEFVEFLEKLRDEGVISNSALNGIVAQQQYPYAASFSAPFSFESLDCYSVDSMAIRYAPSGNEVAREGFREQMLLGSDDQRTMRWRLWRQFDEEIRQPQGHILSRYGGGTENDREIGLIEGPFLHWPDEKWKRNRWQNIGEPFGRGSATRLDVCNIAGFVRPPNTPTVARGEGEVFFDYICTDSNGNQLADLVSGNFSFWYKPNADLGGNNRVLFDAAERNNSNRISCLWWGNRRRGQRLSQHNSGLVFRIKDRTLEYAYTECRFELEPDMFRRGHWYHIHLNWKGTNLGECSLIIDGDGVCGDREKQGFRVRGETDHTFYRNIIDWAAGPTRHEDWVARTSTLADDICGPPPTAAGWPAGTPGLTDIRIQPEDIRAFENYGVLLVGDEIIEYSMIDAGGRFLNVRRGVRGSVWQAHPRGAKITIYGYTTQIQNIVHDFLGYPSFPNETGIPALPSTKSHDLASDMGDSGLYRITRGGSETDYKDHFLPQVFAPDAGFVGFDGSWTRAGEELYLPVSNGRGLQQKGFVGVFGVAWRGYARGYPTLSHWYPDFEPTNGVVPDYPCRNNTQMQWNEGMLKFEFIEYDGIDSQGRLRVIARYDENFTKKVPAEYWHFAGSYTEDQVWADPNDAISTSMCRFFGRGTLVFPVSIHVTKNEKFHPHSFVQIEDEWFFYDRKLGNDLLVMGNGQYCMNWAAGISRTLGQPPLTDAQLQPCGYFRGNLNYFTLSPRGAAMPHAVLTPVVPCFAGTIENGANDMITLVNGKNQQKEQQRIRNVRGLSLPPQVVAPPGATPIPQFIYVLALPDHTEYDHMAGMTSICKFPTGELPVEMPTNWSFGGPDPRTDDTPGGPAEGFFDSFEMKRYNRGDFITVQPLTELTSWGGDIEVNTVAGLATGVGVVRIDDEIIAYRGAAVVQVPRQVMQGSPPRVVTIYEDHYYLLDVERGAMGTIAASHAQHSSIMNLASVRVARPKDLTFPVYGDPNPRVVNVINPRTNRLELIAGDAPMKSWGFLRIEQGYWRVGARKADDPLNEVVGYQFYDPAPNNGNARGQQIRLITPVMGKFNMQNYPALFRGAYGTIPADWSNYALVYDQPVRFPDWFPGVDETYRKVAPCEVDSLHGIPGCQSPEMQYFQGAMTLRNSDWGEMRWQLSWNPHASEFMHSDSLTSKLFVRYDGKGDWGSRPTNQPGGLYVYDFDINSPYTRSLELGVYEQRDHPSRISTAAAGSSPVPPQGQTVRADRIEWRICFYFTKGAFDREDWKNTLQFHEFNVEVNQRTRVLRHEEKR
ncbi:MAG: hypothetical protein IT462_12720 [Planctomycetes bacterium]|nr:hypothetical protein [Planctomycetota bacterium]